MLGSDAKSKAPAQQNQQPPSIVCLPTLVTEGCLSTSRKPLALFALGWYLYRPSVGSEKLHEINLPELHIPNRHFRLLPTVPLCLITTFLLMMFILLLFPAVRFFSHAKETCW